MTIKCPKCKKQYSLDGAKVTGSGVKITCPACRHQFAVRKKQEKQEKKQAPKSKKTPACEICGKPSTHVFAGPPPKPLCEHHYQIEKEKESRFFEEDSGIEKDLISAPDPGATRIAAPSPDGHTTKVAPPPPAKSPGATEAVFDSFDDDFDYADEKESAKPEPAPADTGDGEQVNLPASPHEFLEPEADLAPAAGADGPSPPGPAAPPSDPFGAEDMDFSAPSSEPADPFSADDMDFSAPTSEEADPFSPDSMGMSSPQPDDPGDLKIEGSLKISKSDPFQPDGPAKKSSPPPREKAPPEPIKTQDEFNLDGTPNEDNYSDQDEENDAFDFESSRDAQPAPSTMSSLDDEVGMSLETEARESSPDSEVSVPSSTLKPSAATPIKPRGMASAFLTLFFLLIATAASAYFSFSDKGDYIPGQGLEVNITIPAWEGRLGDSMENDDPEFPMSSLPTLKVEGQKKSTKKSAKAKDHLERAMELMLKDTRPAYKKALKEIGEAITIDPNDPDLLALKINMLAFRESQDDKGRTVKKSKESKRALDALKEEIKKDPVFFRAKAHVLLNRKKTAAAKALLAQYMKKHPKDAMAFYLLGAAYRYQPKPDIEAATKNLEKAIKLEPYLIRAYWDLAKIYRSRGRYDDAMNVYSQILTLSPDRNGTAEAMEETQEEKDKAAAKPVTDTDDSSDLITIPIDPKQQKSRGIKATGTKFTDNILKVISEVRQPLGKLKFEPAKTQTNPTRPGLPRPPEEAPQ